MKLSVREAAAFLNQPESQIDRWIKEGTLPAHKMSDRYWFNRAELLEWATAQGISVDPAMFPEPESQRAQEASTIADALERGGVHYDVPGDTKEDILRAIVERLPVTDGDERACLLEMLLAREAMGSTGVGDGIALPHVRGPIVSDDVDEPVISLSYLARPVEFNAIDQKPVSIVFTLMTPSVKGHLYTLSRLAYLLRDKTWNEAVRARSPAAKILALARELEAKRAAHDRPRLSPSS